MAAHKSLNVYAIAEAEGYFRKALAIVEQNPTGADPLLAARVVVGLLETLMLKSDYREAGEIAEKFMPVVRGAGETPELVTAYYYQTCRWCSGTSCGAGLALMTEAVAIAERLGDGRARAFAGAGLLHCRTRLGLDTVRRGGAAQSRCDDRLPTLGRQLPPQLGLFLHHLGLPLSWPHKRRARDRHFNSSPPKRRPATRARSASPTGF